MALSSRLLRATLLAWRQWLVSLRWGASATCVKSRASGAVCLLGSTLLVGLVDVSMGWTGG